MTERISDERLADLAWDGLPTSAAVSYLIIERAYANKQSARVAELEKNLETLNSLWLHTVANAEKAEAALLAEQKETLSANALERDLTATDHENANLRVKLANAKAALAVERMRLVACSVLAGCNTRESAKQARDMHPDYWCPAVADVAAAVNREIDLRESLARVKALPENLTDSQIADACMWLRHDFGLLTVNERRTEMCSMREYYRALWKAMNTPGRGGAHAVTDKFKAALAEPETTCSELAIKLAPTIGDAWIVYVRANHALVAQSADAAMDID